MSRRALLLGIVLGTLAAGCSQQDVLEALEGMPPLSVTDESIAVPATIEARVALDAVVPSDLQALPDGGFVVLDGWNRRLLLFTAAAEPAGVIQGDATWGRPTRVQVLEGGYLLADPGTTDVPGAVLRVDAGGAVLELLHPSPAPVAVLQRGDDLLVADRTLGLLTCDRAATTCAPYSDGPPRLLSDLAPLRGEGFAAADPLGSRVLLHGPLGAREFGQFGHYVGALAQPKALTAAGDGLLVVDSALGVAQLFGRTGRPLGAAVADGALLRLNHPLAVRSLLDGRYALLAAGEPAVVVVSLAPEALGQASERALGKRLRTPLPSAEIGEREACLQCHDGFLSDSRGGWDPSRRHHPVGIVPERPLPAFFPLDAGGRIACGTCHSPHGVVDVGDAEGVSEPRGRAALVRHQSRGGTMVRLDTDGAAICLPCHREAAHGGLVERGGLVEGGSAGHPVGSALRDALARRPSGEPHRGDCLGCHVAHAAGSEPLLRASDLGGTCLGCHEEHGLAATNHPHGRAFGRGAVRPGASARGVLTDGGIGCSTCHDVAQGQRPGLLRPLAAPPCLGCHDASRGPRGSAHRRIRGSADISCLGCHATHGTPRSEHLLRPQRRGPAGCLSCHTPHATGAGPGVTGHPVAAVGAGDRAVAGCATCHDPHTPEQATPACATCHPTAAAAATRLGGHGGAACATCHPVHGRPPPPPPSAAAANPASRPCLACHAPDAAGAAKRVQAFGHPRDVFLPDGRRWRPLATLPLFDADGAPAASDANGDLACSSCHRVHGGEAGDVAPLQRRGAVEACAACHGADSLPLFRWFHDPARRPDARPPESPP